MAMGTVSRYAALKGAPKGAPTPPPEAPAPDPEEASESYHLSAEQLAELNASGTVQCDEGCTITADIGEEQSEPAAESGAEGMPENLGE